MRELEGHKNKEQIQEPCACFLVTILAPKRSVSAHAFSRRCSPLPPIFFSRLPLRDVCRTRCARPRTSVQSWDIPMFGSKVRAQFLQGVRRQ